MEKLYTANDTKRERETCQWGWESTDGRFVLKYNRNFCRCDGSCILICLSAIFAVVSFVTTPESKGNAPTLLSPEERYRLLDMLVHASSVLSEHNITHWLDFGSLLGAVRNGKIIDWDDDGAMRSQVPYSSLVFERPFSLPNISER